MASLTNVVPAIPSHGTPFTLRYLFVSASASTRPAQDNLISHRTGVLHLVYAIGGRFLQTSGETGDFHPEHHYEQATKYLENILQLHDIRSVQFLLLLSIYKLHSIRWSEAWTYIGLAMRTCIVRHAATAISHVDAHQALGFENA